MEDTTKFSNDQITTLWDNSKIFESNVNEKTPKYFITVPYPYTSGALHIGHARSYTLGDVAARYYRMKGFNVLFPMAFHITGTPILAIAKRIERNDQEIIKMHKGYVSIYETDEKTASAIVESFKNPENLANYYANVIIADFKRMGYSIDWRRKFNTGEKFYNKFVEWQYKKLWEKNLITKGKHAVYFCPSCNNPVTTDDIKGGDELSIEMSEYFLIKEKLVSEGDENTYLIAATLRPETIFGITNLWINPTKIYVKARAKDKEREEIWIISKKASEKLKKQGKDVVVIEEFNGENLIEKKAKIPLTNKEVEILSADFVDDDTATGVVNSVPAHAPYDYMALKDLNLLNEIKILKIIDSCLTIEDAVKGITDQKDEHLEDATQELYKDEFYKGIMNENCMEFNGMKVSIAKEKVAEKIMSLNLCDIFCENNIKEEGKNGKIVKAKCRCGTELEIRVIEDQWFLNYADEGWKKMARKILKSIAIEPEIYRTSFENSIGWLHEWSCTRNRGLGTKFPFDNKWMIESLSDSTIYMSFYTISHLLRNLDVDELDEKFFDYVFLGKEFNNCGKYEEIRKEFLYYYPMDERRTGIAHISNHLTFCLFHHAAIFPENLWPKKFSLNEMLVVEGKKMAKSLGNVIPLKNACDKFGADTVRMYLCYAADTSSALNWVEKEVMDSKAKIDEFVNFVSSAQERRNEYCSSENDEEISNADRWLISRFNRNLKEFTNLMDKSEVRQALQKIFYEFLNDVKWYMRRKTDGKGIGQISEEWVMAMSIFIPFTCERLWKDVFKKENFISEESGLKADERLIDERIEGMEEMIVNMMDNARNFKKMIEKYKEATTIFIYFAEDWKRELFVKIKDGMSIKDVMAEDKFKKNVKDVIPIMQKTHKGDIKFIPTLEEEVKAIEEAKEFLEKELNLKVNIDINADHDPKGGRRFAMPLKPGIYIE